jgi:hypothetical protein
MSNNKIFFTVFTIILLIISLFNVSSGISVNNISDLNNKRGFDGYIIQFNEEPLIKFKNQLIEKAVNFITEKVNNYKEELLAVHNKAKKEISNLFNLDDSSSEHIITEFFELFNGIYVKNLKQDEISIIKKLPYVKDIIPNYKVKINLDNSVPLLGANEIWEYHDEKGKSLTGNGVNIAIIDTGVNYKHVDLKDNYKGGYDFVNNDDDPMDDHGHGTHCAGIALGSGETSNYVTVGVAPMANLYAYKAVNSNGEGLVSDILNAIQQALEEGVDIISLSLGNNNTMASPDSILSQAADNAVDAGLIVVAAAGNDGDEGPISSPGCARKVICVGATDNNDNIASFTSHGPVDLGDGNYLIKPDIVAPGVKIKSCSLKWDYIIKSGTSMATPHVAGAAALILQNNPNLSPQEVKKILKENAVDIGFDENISGKGRVDIFSSINIDDEVIIKSPYRVYEKEKFVVSIFDSNYNPIKAIVIVWNPLHIPRLKYGSNITFIAPIFYGLFKSNLCSKIYIINQKDHLFKKVEIIVTYQKTI